MSELSDGPPPALAVAAGLARRGVYVVPVLVAVGAALWGTDGALSVGYGLAIVVVNTVLAAGMIDRAARRSAGLVGAAVLFGFLVRLGVILVAVTLVRDRNWIDLVPLGLTIILSHLGLLVWESWSVARSLARLGFQGAGSSARSGRSGPETNGGDG